MNRFFLITFFFLLVSCASKYDMIDIENRITLAEDRQWDEIRRDVKTLIEAHPELTPEQKTQISKEVIEGFERHRTLKVQERSAVNLLLKASLNVDESEDFRKGLRKKLRDIYDQKAENIDSVIEAVGGPLRSIPPADDFETDFGILLRDFR